MKSLLTIGWRGDIKLLVGVMRCGDETFDDCNDYVFIDGVVAMCAIERRQNGGV